MELTKLCTRFLNESSGATRQNLLKIKYPAAIMPQITVTPQLSQYIQVHLGHPKNGFKITKICPCNIKRLFSSW